jgi:hypothetical protein
VSQIPNEHENRLISIRAEGEQIRAFGHIKSPKGSQKWRDLEGDLNLQINNKSTLNDRRKCWDTISLQTLLPYTLTLIDSDIISNIEHPARLPYIHASVHPILLCK